MVVINNKIGVSQKAIILNEDGKILAIRRSNTAPTRPLYWDLPGGILEEGEDKVEAIKREIKEETGLEVESISVISEGTWHEEDYSWTTTCYLAKPKTTNITLSYEHDEYKWVTKEEFKELKALPLHKEFVRIFYGNHK